ncbi:MAG: hypothetical protein IPG53_08630 [Ignavibacteriales bacterium]|nr:hypothetical protein [Ignavibacteriales bacterium]
MESILKKYVVFEYIYQKEISPFITKEPKDMLEPKYFYRKLDSLLAGIGKEKTGKAFLVNIVTLLEKTFGDDLQIRRGRIYEEVTGNYELIYPGDGESGNYTLKIPADSIEVTTVLKTRLYIFDEPTVITKFLPIERHGYSVPAAFVVNNPDKRFIFVFELLSGWVREEIEFASMP